MWDGIFANYMMFLLILVRMMGMILFNPLLGRKNVPAIVRVGLAVLLAIVLTGSRLGTQITVSGIFEFEVLAIKELLVGYCIGFVLQLFLGAILTAGELIDIQMGFSMSKVYDPQSNISMPMSGSIFNLMFILIFFVSNAHLVLFRIMGASLDLVPPGHVAISQHALALLAGMMADALIFAVKLALPVVAAEIISEMGLGIIMRAVPQINMFVVGLQLKVVVGLLVLIFVMPQTIDLLDLMTDKVFTGMSSVLSALNSG